MLWAMRPTARASPIFERCAELDEQGLGLLNELLDELEEEILLGRLVQEAELSEDDRVDGVRNLWIWTDRWRRGGNDRHVSQEPGHERAVRPC